MLWSSVTREELVVKVLVSHMERNQLKRLRLQGCMQDDIMERCSWLGLGGRLRTQCRGLVSQLDWQHLWELLAVLEKETVAMESH